MMRTGVKKRGIDRLLPLLIFVLLCCIFNPPASDGFTTTVAGQSITWNFGGIPTANILIPVTPCRNDWGSHYECRYIIQDPPYVYPITFSASMQPTYTAWSSLDFGYYHDYFMYRGQYYRINEASSRFPAPLDLSTSFFIPAEAAEFDLIYIPEYELGVIEGASITLAFWIENSDPARALLGGGDVNPDTEYCDEQAQPGKPRIRKFKNQKGAGPGK